MIDPSSDEWEKLLDEVQAKVQEVCERLPAEQVTEFMEDVVSILEQKLIALIELEQGP